MKPKSKHYAKYRFNGEDLPKNKLVYKAIEKYKSEHANTNLTEICNDFENINRILGGFKLILSENEFKNYKLKSKDSVERYDEMILGNGEILYICNQWGGKDTMEKVIDELRELGFDVDVIEDGNSHKMLNSNDKENDDESIEYKKLPLNQILYGPAGTGKTYHTINRAIEIIENRAVSDTEDRNELKAKFDSYKNNGQIVFTTFHQSYGYEEFIEGIKPILADAESNTMRYEVEDGIFKELCRKAQSVKIPEYQFDADSNVWKIILDSTKMTELKKHCFKYGEIRIGFGEIEYDEKATSYQKLQINNFKEEMKKGDIVVSHAGKYHIDAIGIIAGDYEREQNESNDIEKRFISKRKVKWLWYTQNENEAFNIKNFRNLQFSRQTTYILKDINIVGLIEAIKSEYHINLKVEKESKNYVIIIDEINRGNISKIFGELITLIEPSKRIDADGGEGLEVKLPYSKKSFGISKNVYIIGTMNTADRSIALMDTALRRRFEFTEMMPNPKLLNKEVDEISLSELLSVINNRIVYLYNRNHQIGHSYFLDINSKKELDHVFKHKIIPLLQEYFYDDWVKIQMVLGDYKVKGVEDKNRFVISKNLDSKTILGFDDEQDQVMTYTINDEFTQEAYLKIVRQSSIDNSHNE